MGTAVQPGLKGVIAAGHPATADAGAVLLEAGGNAFDAALGALCAACVAEPVLASLGGGGFLLADPAGDGARVYDFFAQTPGYKRPPDQLDFRPIRVDFGVAQQEFHIGLGSAAVPGVIKGLFRIHRDLCRLPLTRIIEPAARLARDGIIVNPLQYQIARLVEPIIRATPGSLSLHQPEGGGERLAEPGERVRHPEFAAILETLAAEGEQLFYQGELGAVLSRHCAERGGQLRRDDLAAYRVERRPPLRVAYRGAELLTNPPPALGGLLIGLTLALLERDAPEPPPWGSVAQRAWIARAMARTQDLRQRSDLPARLAGDPDGDALLAELLAMDGGGAEPLPRFSRGTTHISVLDQAGNLASLSLSNGEGCGYLLPGTGILLNNMLGEEDLAPGGFHRWPENRRISSMMAPSVARLADGTRVALGSGGSNRIRGAILQVVSHLIDAGLPLDQAVAAPRIHYEGDLLNLEPPCSPALCQELRREFPNLRIWDGLNLFFGGVHSVLRRPDGGLRGCGDPRRGGASRLV